MKTPEEIIGDILQDHGRLKWLSGRSEVLEVEWELYQKMKGTDYNPWKRALAGDQTDATVEIMNQMADKRREEIIGMFEAVREHLGVCLLSEDKVIRKLANYILEEENE